MGTGDGEVVNVGAFLQILHSICRIAEVLLTLQQVGNVNYTGWVLKVRCSTDRQIINQLQSQASAMEEELSKWEEDVKSQRDSFYELNYYTTLQLLTLRRELGRLKTPSKGLSIFPEVLALLRSISTQVHPSHVINAVNQVLEAAKKPEPVPSEELPPDLPVGVDEESVFDEAASTGQDAEQPEEDNASAEEHAFSEEDLSEELKGYVTTISFRINCSRKLVLKAFEVLGQDLTRLDYERWCDENLEEYKFEEDVSSDEESSGSESDSESSDGTSSDSEDEQFSYVPGNTWLCTGHSV